MQISKWGRHSCLPLAHHIQTHLSVLWCAVLASLFVVGFAGCSGSKSGPATVEVTGTVTLDGNPVEGANILFSPDLGSSDGRLASQAATDGAGAYKLTTHVGGGKFKSGIVPGKYVVTIVKLDTAAAKTTLVAPKNLLPPKFADPKTSPLKAEVEAGKANDFPFALEAE